MCLTVHKMAATLQSNVLSGQSSMFNFKGVVTSFIICDNEGVWLHVWS